jgi:hypothetical protein
MSHMVIPHPHGGRTISITERQMLSLRDKNKQLEGKMNELLQFGEENDSISEKMHRLAVGMIAAASFQSVLHTLNFHLRDDFAIPPNGHDSRDTPDDESHDRPPLTCSAHSGLHAGIVRRAGSMLPEFPASPPALLPQGEKGVS